MLLSICIAVYNQIELVRENISEIVKYKGDDIEIVVSDDCSTEPIEQMLLDFGDSRIKYFRTAVNKSHDGNILNGLRNCCGDYVFLFRSKDIIIPEKIDEVKEIIKCHPKASYFLFSALDENYKKRMVLEDKAYKQNEEAQNAHDKLLVHPSGQVYKRSFLRLNLYEKYIDTYFPKFNGCDVHQLIRMDLALQGDFVTSSCCAWRYAYTFQAKEASVISTEKKLNIYAPYYQYQRYECEMNFANNEFQGKNKVIFLKQIIKSHGWRIVPLFMLINRSEEYNRHYNSAPISFSPYKELIIFMRRTLKMLKTMKKKSNICLGGVQPYFLCQVCKIGVYDIPVTSIKIKVFSNKLLSKIWFKIRGTEVNT